MRNTFNIWMYNEKAQSATGPWIFMAAVVADNAASALEIAKSRYGSDRQFEIHGSFDVARP